jgi:cytoskeletal protein RodZ
MSLSLGEKLRQAREERGISISEVAEQTRISAIYLESIENDDYKTLPGGIFNKGFVKSYAKFIGFDEQEALSDYARLASENEVLAEQPLKVYKPEVLTDDTSSRSILPTLIFAVVILGLMTVGVLFLLNYLQSPGRRSQVIRTRIQTQIRQWVLQTTMRCRRQLRQALLRPWAPSRSIFNRQMSRSPCWP